MCTLVPLVYIIINSIEPVYVMNLMFVLLLFFSRTSLDDRCLTSSLLSHTYSISVCPKDDIQKMTIFLSF